MTRLSTTALALLVVAGTALAQEGPGAARIETPSVLPDPGPPVPRELELAIGKDHSWLAFRTPYSRNNTKSHIQLELIATEREDFLLGGSLLRWSDTGPSSPWNVGIGISAWAGLLDGPPDGVVAVALTGAAAYRIPTKLPVTATARVSFAPDITSFEDADGMTDAQARLEVAIDDSAVAFVGYRFFEVELAQGGDVELGDEFVFGVRLGL